jgi:hypothetical protein
MDKTIESYKKEVETLQLCCPVDTESDFDSQAQPFSIKGRKRRSLETSMKPAAEVSDPSYVPDDYVTKVQEFEIQLLTFPGHNDTRKPIN